MSWSEAERRRALEAAGATGAAVDELLEYGRPLLPSPRLRPVGVPPLPEEPQLLAWSRYETEARSRGCIAALADVFPQLRFPIERGVSETSGYRAATRRGEEPEPSAGATGLVMRRPEGVTLSLCPTLAGRVPMLVADDRGDFEDLVRAFSARNEPADVPASMGACLVRGLNDWSRIRIYRESWEAANPDGDWDDEFRRLIPRKELYEDRLVILSTGPYSGVPASAAGLPEPEWLSLSLQIRREHESTHYFTLRTVGVSRTNLVDELIADYVALLRTFGAYREDLARLFFGLEGFPAYREGARLQNYRGKLSNDAFHVTKRLVSNVIVGLARLPVPATDSELARQVLEMAACSLEELGGTDLALGTASHAALRLELSVPNDGAGVAAAIAAFDAFAAKALIPRLTASELRVVLDEVLSNKAKYGWKDGETHRVHVAAAIRDGGIALEFVDDGEAFDVLAAPDPETSQPIFERPIGGLGILLVKRLTDEQLYERREGINRLRLTKTVPPSS